MHRVEITSPEAYLQAVSDQHKGAVNHLYQLVQTNIAPGFECAINWGMIVWQVPVSILPHTYNKQPLTYLALAGQKNYVSFYTLSTYQRPNGQTELADGFEAAGKKLEMGKSCIRFKNINAIPDEVLAREVRYHTVESFIAEYQSARSTAGKS